MRKRKKIIMKASIPPKIIWIPCWVGSDSRGFHRKFKWVSSDICARNCKNDNELYEDCIGCVKWLDYIEKIKKKKRIKIKPINKKRHKIRKLKHKKRAKLRPLKKRRKQI